MAYSNLINRKLKSNALNQNSFSKEDKFKVLIIEDNQLIQLIHKKMLIELNCDVDIVSSGEEALLMVDNYYDLILLDIGLPGINGIETAIKIREHEKHLYTKIIAVTTSDKNYINNICISAEINEILTKPISIEQLKILINTQKQDYNQLHN